MMQASYVNNWEFNPQKLHAPSNCSVYRLNNTSLLQGGSSLDDYNYTSPHIFNDLKPALVAGAVLREAPSIQEMKRGREMEEGSEIKSAIGELSMLAIKLKPGGDDHDHGHDDFDAAADHMPTGPILCICGLVIQVLDKIGPTMAVLRQDISQNIQRLEKVCDSDPALYSNLLEILKKEADEGNARKRSSCSKAFVWLTRSLDFTIALLERLAKEPGQNMEQAVEESYNITLKPWHGWISTAAFKVALKLVPDNKTFIDILKKKDESHEVFQEDLKTLISLLAPVLEQIHSIVKLYSLDRLKST